MSRLPIPTVQSRSNHGNIELGRQSLPEYSALYPDISSSASPPSSPSFLFLYLGSISIAIIILLAIYFIFISAMSDLAVVAIIAILALVGILVFVLFFFNHLTRPRG
ncbi:hypothetical protein EV426DRAFT_605875 [Tirmania nivea]|nr:hypothetical protein EV426DRAFT_605875 [Tirmania nivea]